MEKVSLADKFDQFKEHWRPKRVASLNGQDVKLIKCEGEFPWHSHETVDEMFLCWQGRLTVDFENKSVELEPGDLIVVPRGIRHRTRAEAEALVLVFEPTGVVNTGDAEASAFTAPVGVDL